MERLLDHLDRPSLLKKMTRPDLLRVCEELRQRIIEVVSATGGHLAPSLGVVELTVALHYVFDTPVDKIIWDVGHQSYAHKILTGRNRQFATLRQAGGISGFPKRAESEYDAFGTGHASTSISAALGIACARDLHAEQYQVIAVIGDGSMSGGLALEGINQAGASQKNMIVILNDNEMSISRNVGALSQYFNKLISTPIYRKLRDDFEELVRRIPTIGTKMHPILKKIEESLKNLIIPGVVFEELGFHYYGPIDGHNLDGLIDLLQQVRLVKGPALIHCITKKGKGYNHAETDPETFHGSGPFAIADGKARATSNNISYTKVFAHWLNETAGHNDRVVAITAAMAKGTGLEKFKDQYPARFFDVGIAEGHAVTFAAGLSTEGFVPVVAIYSSFLQRAFDQILHDVALQNLPVVFAIDRAGLVGEDGPTHHGVFDIAFLSCIPNLVVAMAADEIELQRLLYTAVESKRPFAVRYPRDCAPGTRLLSFADLQPLAIGSWEIRRQGKNVCLLAYGGMVDECVSVAEQEDCTLVNARFLKPIDDALLARLTTEHMAIVVVEESVPSGGLYAAVKSALDSAPGAATSGPAGSPEFRRITISRIGLPDAFVEHGDLAYLRQQYGLTAEHILNHVRKSKTATA